MYKRRTKSVHDNVFSNSTRRGFRLPQRSHVRTLKDFVGEKSGKRCEKSGKYWIKSGDREIFFLYPRLKSHQYDESLCSYKFSLHRKKL